MDTPLCGVYCLVIIIKFFKRMIGSGVNMVKGGVMTSSFPWLMMVPIPLFAFTRFLFLCVFPGSHAGALCLPRPVRGVLAGARQVQPGVPARVHGGVGLYL
jgi:hypothetical protein